MRADSYKIAVIGGDKRQVYLARILAKKGYEVAVYGLCERVHDERIREATSVKEALKEVDAAVGPVPFIRSGKITGTYEIPDMNVEMLFDELPENAVFFAGNIPSEVRRYAEGKGLRACDMMIDELVAARNAVATAEGAVAEAIARSPVNLTKSRCLVLGYGRCGRMLMRLLKSFFCKVIVSEKDNTRAADAFVLADGIVSEAELTDAVGNVDFIFNTVPERILSEERLRHVGKNTWILDIASAPGGVDYRATEALSVNAVLLPGLPGRYAPASSAEILADFIENQIRLR
ncbi:dipicolinate synthase [Mediterraneibacter glycyrrhizinilyticus]|nr:dipicolinate synthase subunit DpsA [Mediterraneibacter glycyrrhizinilyticus]MBM6803695.1 dipicolinate synthase [Mediterraneibacter glycyrrhizinilyticus]